MKKTFLLITLASFLLSGCFIAKIFHKKEKYGCPTNGRNVGAEKLLDENTNKEDKKAAKKAAKAKFKG
ncbi:MAG: hypothetical protein ABJA78_12955 [Ferruginibacter sp.]